MGIFKPNNETGGKSGGWLNDALFGKDSKPRAQMEDGQYRQIVGMDTSIARDNKELYVDHTTTYENLKGYTLTITHVASGDTPIGFKGMLTEFKDNFQCQWANETVYGRMDDIYTFQNTRRSIDVGVVIPAFDARDARSNLVKVNTLTKYLYPTYAGAGGGSNVSNISQAPLLRIRFANLIQDGRKSVEQGLLGKIDGFSFSPVLEDGFFDYPGLLYPKTINIQFKFDVLHEHVVGWTETAKGTYDFGGGNAPGFPNTVGPQPPSNTVEFPTGEQGEREAILDGALELDDDLNFVNTTDAVDDELAAYDTMHLGFSSAR
tara:strand:+ start:183 stop:1139 length:957 start_codon:yes stop_codon:yes gene_type:complete